MIVLTASSMLSAPPVSLISAVSSISSLIVAKLGTKTFLFAASFDSCFLFDYSTSPNLPSSFSPRVGILLLAATTNPQIKSLGVSESLSGHSH